MKQSGLIPIERIEKAIYLIRGERVMLDYDLAALYQVSTKALNQAVGRNRERFPIDSMFQLTVIELNQLNRSQVVTGSQKHRNPKFGPHAFTEHGILMLSSVLDSDRAVQVNIEIMRAFVNLRRMLASNVELAGKLKDLESKYDQQFKVVFDAVRQLISPPRTTRKPIGFH
jgi:hypothetical protein